MNGFRAVECFQKCLDTAFFFFFFLFLHLYLDSRAIYFWSRASGRQGSWSHVITQLHKYYDFCRVFLSVAASISFIRLKNTSYLTRPSKHESTCQVFWTLAGTALAKGAMETCYVLFPFLESSACNNFSRGTTCPLPPISTSATPSTIAGGIGSLEKSD